MSPCDRAHMTSYWRSIVNMSLSRVVSEILNIEKCRDIEFGSQVTQGHWKWYHSIDWVWCPISVLYSNFVPNMHRLLWYSTSKRPEDRVRGLSRLLKMSPFDTAYDLTSIIVIIGLSRTVSETDGDFSQIIAKFSHHRVFCAPLKGFALELGISTGGKKLE